MRKILILSFLFVNLTNAEQHTKSFMGADSTNIIPQVMMFNTTQNFTTGSVVTDGRIVSCNSPTTESKTEACPSGQIGSLTYSRQVKQCSDGLTSSYQSSDWTLTGGSCVTPAPPPPPPACTSTTSCTIRDAIYTWVNGSLVKVPGSDGQGQCLQQIGTTYCNGKLTQWCNYTIGFCANY